MAGDLTVGVAIDATNRFSAETRKIAESSGRLAERPKAGQGQLDELEKRDAALKCQDAVDTRMGRTATAMDSAARRATALLRLVKRELREQCAGTASAG